MPTCPIDTEDAVRRIREDGYAVVPDFIDKMTVERLRAGLAPIFDAIRSRTTEEHGQQTNHTHNLLAKTRAVDEVLMDDRLLELVGGVLGPDFQISGVAAMRPAPGDHRQWMHQDDGHYPIPRPHPPLIVNTLIALDPFTVANGATEVVPGSHRRVGRVDPDAQTVSVEMPLGALLLWEGALWHRGGGNSTRHEYRRSINVNFNLAWLKQRENQFIGVPPEVVVEMPEKLQALIGYKLTNFGLGTVDYRNPIETVKRRLAGTEATAPVEPINRR
ncbi:MAG: phytanoyl-CoA dioxygenase family protein [Pseudomonadales bacterium]|nr:phytanoyl-CoA dioxygenase family protein [Pseudomonadales bacterium]